MSMTQMVASLKVLRDHGMKTATSVVMEAMSWFAKAKIAEESLTTSVLACQSHQQVIGTVKIACRN
jgi:hypothetical protein